MEALNEARKTWPKKTDEWLYERLNLELKQKLEEIQRLLKEKAMCEANSNAVIADVLAEIEKEAWDIGYEWSGKGNFLSIEQSKLKLILSKYFS